MKNKNVKEALLSTAICLIPMVAGICVYGKLPEEIPTKWYMDGTVGQFAHKNLTVFGLPGLMAAINLIVHFSMNTDPKRQKMAVMLKRIVKWLLPVMTMIASSSALFWGLGYELPVNVITPLLIGILFIAIGNYMPKCKQNYTMGIKLPWTLHSEENWNRTHRLAGYLWIFEGFGMIVTAFLQKSFPQAATVLLIGILCTMAIVPVVYSYMLYRKGI
ncbi:MAG: SdpI family protein [Clostridiales bacterium]|nr:SdpI family protein [Clostridiales bacterium]